MKRLLIGTIILAGVSGCLLKGGDYAVDMGLFGTSTGLNRETFQIGDTVTLVAAERCYNGLTESGCPAYPKSTDAPNDYTFSVTDSSVAQPVAANRVWFRKLGTVTIHGATDRATGTLAATVVPRIRSVAISPRSLSLAVGDTASVFISAYDSTGAPVPLERAWYALYFHPASFGTTGPVVGTNGTDATRDYFRAVQTGIASYVVESAVYRTTGLRDTLTIVVH